MFSRFNAIERGQIECWEMPHEETIRIMRMMDELRNEWGIVYPFEENGMHNELLEALEIEEKPITTISTDAEEEVMAYTPLFDAEVAKGEE